MRSGATGTGGRTMESLVREGITVVETDNNTNDPEFSAQAPRILATGCNDLSGSGFHLRGGIVFLVLLLTKRPVGEA